MVKQASPARVDREHSADFVRQMARHLKAIIRQAQGHPDPWGNKRWRERQPQSVKTQPEGNAYAEKRFKRDPSALS